MSRSLRKTEAADLRSRYAIFIQIGLVVSLTLFIFVFNRHMTTATPSYIEHVPTIESVVFEEIQPTVHYQPPPPPPPLPPPVAVEDLIDMPDDLIFNEEPDLTMIRVTPPEPLPPPDIEPIPERPMTEEIFELVEVAPVPIGGLEGIQRRVVYPEAAIRVGIEGRVYIGFVVGQDGVPRDIEVLRSLCPACDEAAVKAIRDTRFEPGFQRGQPVSVRLSIPIIFRLQ